MRKIGALVIALALLSGCSRGPRIIPDDTMVDIYVEMLMADQWLMRNRLEKPKADTTLFYEPVFEKYGYTFQDYQASVYRKIANPEKYERMVKMIGVRIEKQKTELEALRTQREKNNAIQQELGLYYDRRTFSLGDLDSECSESLPSAFKGKEIPML